MSRPSPGHDHHGADSGGAGFALLVSFGANLSVDLAVAGRRLVIAVRLVVGRSSVVAPAVEDGTSYRAGRCSDHRRSSHLAPPPTARLAGLYPLCRRGQQGGDPRRNAVLYEVPGALKLRCGPRTRRLDAVLGGLAGPSGYWLQTRCHLARASQRAVGSVVTVHLRYLPFAMRIRLAISASPVVRDQPFRKRTCPGSVRLRGAAVGTIGRSAGNRRWAGCRAASRVGVTATASS